MKTHLVALAVLAFAGDPAFAETAAPAATPSAQNPPLSTAPTTAPKALVVVVDVPKSMLRFRNDDIARAIAGLVQSEFRRRGYRGDFDYEPATPGSERTHLPRLGISLMEWRVLPTRMIECTFTADLVTAQDTKGLGIFSGTALRKAVLRTPSAGPDGFDEAANRAIDDLYRALSATNLLPGAAL